MKTMMRHLHFNFSSQRGGALLPVMSAAAMLSAIFVVAGGYLDSSRRAVSLEVQRKNVGVLEDMVYMAVANKDLCKAQLVANTFRLKAGAADQLKVNDAETAEGQVIVELDIGLRDGAGAVLPLADPDGGAAMAIPGFGFELSRFRIRCTNANCGCEPAMGPDITGDGVPDPIVGSCFDWDAAAGGIQPRIPAEILIGVDGVGQFDGMALGVRAIPIFLNAVPIGPNYRVDSCEASESDSRMCARLGGVWSGGQCNMPYVPFSCPAPTIAGPDNDPTNLADDGDNIPDCVDVFTAQCPFGEYVTSVSNNSVTCGVIGYTWLVPPWSTCGQAATPVAGQNRRYRNVQCVNVADRSLVVADANCNPATMPTEFEPCCQSQNLSWTDITGPLPATCNANAPEILAGASAAIADPLAYPEGNATATCTDNAGFGVYSAAGSCRQIACYSWDLNRECPLAEVVSGYYTAAMVAPALPPYCATCTSCSFSAATTILTDQPAAANCGSPPPAAQCPPANLSWNGPMGETCTASFGWTNELGNATEADGAGPDVGTATFNCLAGGIWDVIPTVSNCSMLSCQVFTGMTWDGVAPGCQPDADVFIPANSVGFTVSDTVSGGTPTGTVQYDCNAAGVLSVPYGQVCDVGDPCTVPGACVLACDSPNEVGNTCNLSRTGAGYFCGVHGQADASCASGNSGGLWRPSVGPLCYAGQNTAGVGVQVDPIGRLCVTLAECAADPTTCCSGGGCAAPIIGACGPAHTSGNSYADAAAVIAAGQCAAGTPSVVASGAGPWNWTCIGANGGGDSGPCTAPVAAGPVGCWVRTDPGSTCDDRFGACNNCSCPAYANERCLIPVVEGSPCALGVSQNAAGTQMCMVYRGGLTNRYDEFRCELACAGATVVGDCGAANGGTYADAAAVNAAGLCDAGTAAPVAGAGPWTWTCLGSGGGANSGLCSANEVAGMKCCDSSSPLGPQNFSASCTTPTLMPSCLVGVPPNGYHEECGLAECSPPLVNGVCGPADTGGPYASAAAVNAAGLCTAGTSAPVAGAGPWNWICAGSGGGSPSPACDASPIACLAVGTTIIIGAGPDDMLCVDATGVSGVEPWPACCSGTHRPDFGLGEVMGGGNCRTVCN